MSLSHTALANQVKSAIQTEVQRCTHDGKFDPSGFDMTIYLQEIYNYITSNASVKGVYTGVVGTNPDPANGQFSFKLTKSDSNPSVTKQFVINSQKSVREFPPTLWWKALTDSLWMTLSSSAVRLTFTLTITPAILKASSTKSWTTQDFDGKDFGGIWEVYCQEIITAVKNSLLTPMTVAATSSNGGTGTIVFTSIE